MLAVVRGRFCKVTRAPGTSPLFLLNPGRLDDRPPFLNFSLVPDAQRLGRLLQARENLLAQVGKPRANLGIRQRVATTAALSLATMSLGAYWQAPTTHANGESKSPANRPH